MTSFAALLDPRPVQPQAALRIMADLTRRTGGPPRQHDAQGLRLWQGAPDSGPATIYHSGPLVLVGDLALTDLATLRSALAAPPGTEAGDLILTAWARWGEAALDRLNGAFAFVISDQRNGQVTAVRDRFGICPLAYAITAHSIILASNLSTVLAGLDETPPVSADWVGDFLSGECVDRASTAWQGVLRLPPGHLLQHHADGTSTLRAWYRLEATSPPPKSDLRELLAHATHQACAMGPTATMLSGGLDSSTLALLSVDGTARPRPALSLRYRDPKTDEGRYIDSVLAQARGGLDPIFLPGELADDAIFDLDPQLDWQDQPFFAPGLNRMHLLYRKARALGCSAILDGHGGDEVIGGTLRDVAVLAQGRGWPTALRLAAKIARFTQESPFQGMAFVLAMQGRHGFGRLGRHLLRQSLGRNAGPDPDLVNPELARQIRLQDRQRDLSRPDPRDRDLPESVRRHARMIAGPMAGLAFETLSHAAQSEHMQPRYLFYDHRVAEFCIWQPAGAKVAQGRPRALLRDAMQGVLPDAVRLRRDKTNFLGGFWATLRRDPEGRIAALTTDHGSLADWVSTATLRADIAQLSQSPDPQPDVAFRLWRAVCLARWLERGAVPARADLSSFQH